MVESICENSDIFGMDSRVYAKFIHPAASFRRPYVLADL